MMAWTLESIGIALENHITNQEKWEEKMGEDMELVKTVIIVGNGEPSLKEQVHKLNYWVGGANKLIWIFIGAVAAQMVLATVGLIVIISRIGLP
jgi:hypothetical protein